MALTNEQFEALKELIKVSIDEAFEDKKVVTEEMLEEKLGYLPSKEDFDKLMKELKAIREENAILNNRSKENRDEIEKLKDIHPDYSHS